MTETTPELMNQMIAEAVDYVHGRARDQIVKQLGNAKDTSETMAAITYKTAEGILRKYKGKGLDAELDLAMGLATEVIDMQMEILERVNPNVVNTNQQRLREDALLRTITMYAENLEDTPETQAQAKEMLASFMQDGSVDTAFGYVNRRAKEEGLNVDDMIRRGNAMAMDAVGGGRRPVADAVQNHVETPEMMQARVRATHAPAEGPAPLMDEPMANHEETPEMMHARVRAMHRR